MIDFLRLSIKAVGDALRTAVEAATGEHLEEVTAGVTQWAHHQASSFENWVVVQTIHAAANFSGIVQAVIVQIGSVLAGIGAQIDAAVWGIEDRFRGLIADAIAPFTALIDDISARLDTLTQSLSEAKDWLLSQITLAVDTAVLKMRKYVNDLFAKWSDLLNGLDNIKVRLFEFFDDPEEWLYKAFDRIIERFW